MNAADRRASLMAFHALVCDMLVDDDLTIPQGLGGSSSDRIAVFPRTQVEAQAWVRYLDGAVLVAHAAGHPVIRGYTTITALPVTVFLREVADVLPTVQAGASRQLAQWVEDLAPRATSAEAGL